jgi:hypothetical protein
MNEIKVASNRIPAILRAIDEISFHTSILALNAAVEAAGEAPAQSLLSEEAANDTLALIEASIGGSIAALRPAAADREAATGNEALRGVAERIRRMRCAPGGSKHPARVAVRQTRSFGDAR